MVDTTPREPLLLRVERDGNPARRYGYASPDLGKLGPLDLDRLDRLASRLVGALPVEILDGSLAVVGLAESSLVLAWRMMAWLPEHARLWFSTRHDRQIVPSTRHLRFLEPHSHGPRHGLTVPEGTVFDAILIVEDEVTTGRTVANLAQALGDTGRRFHVVCLSDHRDPTPRLRGDAGPPGLPRRMTIERIAADLDDATGFAGRTSQPRRLNPYARCPRIFSGALDALRQASEPGELWMIGECIDLPMAFFDLDPTRSRLLVRHVTRSPWKVDGRAIASRLTFRGEGDAPTHYLYNAEWPTRSSVTIVGESATASIHRRIGAELRDRGIESECVEVGVG